MKPFLSMQICCFSTYSSVKSLCIIKRITLKQVCPDECLVALFI